MEALGMRIETLWAAYSALSMNHPVEAHLRAGHAKLNALTPPFL